MRISFKKGIFSLKLWSCIATKQITRKCGFVIQIFFQILFKNLKNVYLLPVIF